MSSPITHCLSEAQKKFYHDNGYLLGLPAIYTREEMAALNAALPNLLLNGRVLVPGPADVDTYVQALDQAMFPGTPPAATHPRLLN